MSRTGQSNDSSRYYYTVVHLGSFNRFTDTVMGFTLQLNLVVHHGHVIQGRYHVVVMYMYIMYK